MSGASSASSPPPRRIVVLGGNGFVGSAVCKELLARKARGKDDDITVTSVSRSGLPPKIDAPWIRDVDWRKGDPSAPNAGDLPAALQGAAAVISTIGGFGNREAMVQKNGQTNVAAIDAAKAKGVPRFVYISAHHYGLPEFLKRGYFEGKLMTSVGEREEGEVAKRYPSPNLRLNCPILAHSPSLSVLRCYAVCSENALADKYKEQGVAVRPGFIFVRDQHMRTEPAHS